MSRELIRERAAEELRAAGIKTEDDENGPSLIAPWLDFWAAVFEEFEYHIAREQEHGRL